MDMQNVSNFQIPEGAVRTIHDKDSRLIWGRVNYDTKYTGDTLQNGTPTPDTPIPVQTVTGEQTVVVHGKNLFDTSTYTTVGSELTIKRNANGSFIVNGTSASVTTIYFNNTIVLNGSYTLAQIGDKTTEQGYVNLYKNSDYTTTIAYFNTASNNHYKNFTTSQVSLSQRLSIPSGTYNNFVFRLILIKGTYNLTTIGNYEPFQSQSYPISLGATELCKIGTYQDYIYKSGDDWYVHKACGKVIWNGTETWQYDSATTRAATANPTNIKTYYTGDLCTHLVPGDSSSATQNNVFNIGGSSTFVKATSVLTSANAWKTWLASNNVILYYALATPTDTKITDATLIGQLNAVHEWLTRHGYNATVSGNLPIIVDRTNL